MEGTIPEVPIGKALGVLFLGAVVGGVIYALYQHYLAGSLNRVIAGDTTPPATT